jgi:hypothetical protein
MYDTGLLPAYHTVSAERYNIDIWVDITHCTKLHVLQHMEKYNSLALRREERGGGGEDGYVLWQLASFTILYPTVYRKNCMTLYTRGVESISEWRYKFLNSNTVATQQA